MTNGRDTIEVPGTPPGSASGHLASLSEEAPGALHCKHGDCGRIADRRGWCDAHYQRHRMGRDMDIPPLRPWVPAKSKGSNYRAAHVKLYRRRGKAGNYNCVKCGLAARDWALRHQDKGIQVEWDPYAHMNFSMNTDDYDPMCKSCHRDYDGIGVNDDW